MLNVSPMWSPPRGGGSAAAGGSTACARASPRSRRRSPGTRRSQRSPRRRAHRGSSVPAPVFGDLECLAAAWRGRPVGVALDVLELAALAHVVPAGPVGRPVNPGLGVAGLTVDHVPVGRTRVAEFHPLDRAVLGELGTTARADAVRW